MKFRTEIELQSADFRIDHATHGFLAGSCFSENISRKLQTVKFPVTANPTGILFNPLSVYAMFRDLSLGRRFTHDDLCQSNGLWFSWSHHGSFSDTDPEKALTSINSAMSIGKAALAAADYVVITFGTAWVFRLTSTGRVVANCHKQPADMFVRERLSVTEIVSAYSELLEGSLKDKKVIFTVSPIRHLKDGFDGNSLSKAILRTAVGELTERYENSIYFPAFEIVTDDLRDYRFYSSDMVHPSPQAVDYIWQKFCDWCMDIRTLSLLPRLERLSQALSHRPNGSDPVGRDKFRKTMLEHISALQTDLPYTDFTAETAYFLR